MEHSDEMAPDIQAAATQQQQQQQQQQQVPLDPPSMESNASIPASSVLRLLSRDSGARLSLMRMLPWKDLASLVASSQSWRAWIAEEPASMGTQPVTIGGVISCSSVALSSFEHCGWIQRVVQDLALARATAPQLEQFLRCMPRLLRLRSLVLWGCDPAVSAQMLRAGFSSVSATLADLCLTLPYGVTPPAAAAVWSAVSALTELVSICVESFAPLSSFDFSFLPSLQRLQRLELQTDDNAPCTDEQVESLAQCKTLTDLRCGQWITTAELMGSVNSRDLAQQTMVQSRLALLVRRRAVSGAAPLRRLFLGDRTLIEQIGWQSLSQCTELEEIKAQWSSALEEADWSRLANFRRLQTLTIHGRCVVSSQVHRNGSLSNLSHVLSPLMQCRALCNLTLFGKSDLRGEHATLIARIPSLERFECWALRIESLSPLSSSPALTALRFSNCRGIHDERINIREMIPPMPFVRQLSIVEDESELMDAVEAEPSTVALLQRLPKLTREHFEQSLKEDSESEEGEEDEEDAEEAADGEDAEQEDQ